MWSEDYGPLNTAGFERVLAVEDRDGILWKKRSAPRGWACKKIIWNKRGFQHKSPSACEFLGGQMV